MEKMLYPAKITKTNEGSYIISFRDVPEALTEVWNETDIEKYALDALLTSIKFYKERNISFPKPSKIQDDEIFIAIPQGNV